MADIKREEFDHLINEFEVFKDSVMDELSKLRQDIEVIKEELSEITKEFSGKLSGSRDQKRLV
jgi:hypothetical protein